jgi:hypothetical protein
VDHPFEPARISRGCGLAKGLAAWHPHDAASKKHQPAYLDELVLRSV